MARTFTREQIRDRIRSEADMVGTTFITDVELNRFISASYAELYDLLVKAGVDYFESTKTYTTTANTASYAMDATHRDTKAVFWQDSNGTLHPVYPTSLRESYVFSGLNGSRSTHYRLAGGNIILYPTPPAGQTYIQYYTPIPEDFDNDADTLEGVSGWEEYVVVDCVIKCLDKEESSTTSFWRRKQELKDRIEAMGFQRYLNEAGRIQDIDQDGLAQGDLYSWWPYRRFV